MARSMTGYGFCEYDLYNRKVSVEIKSVNSKYLDISIKLPRIISMYESDIKNIIKEEVSRGKIDVYINIDAYTNQDVNISFNEELLDKYFEVFDKISDKYGVLAPSMTDILNLDGVITSNENTNDIDTVAEIWETLFVALNGAISNFVKTREDEGDSLKQDILLKIESLNESMNNINEICPIISEEYNERLQKRIFQTLESANIEYLEDDVMSKILTEVGVFCEKSDIDEEVVRFNTNLSALTVTINNENIIGKKIDFILQELGREVNTMASKSQDGRLSSECINLKIILEKIREQSKNFE